MSALDRFLEWWGGELRAMVPTGLFGARQILTVTEADGDALKLHLRRGARARELGEVGKLPRRVQTRLTRAVRDGMLRTVLLIPEDKVLSQDLRLPAAAAGDLGNVVRYELERVTPFKHGEVYYSHSARKDPAPDGRVIVDLLFTPRATIDPVLERLQTAGLPAAAIDVANTDGIPGGHNLMRRTSAASRTPGQRLAVGLTLIAVMLGALWGWMLFKVQGDEIDRLQHSLTTERRALIATRDAAAPTGQDATAKQAAHALRSTTALSVEVLDAVADTLPDDSWIERLSLRGDRLEFTGTSANATALIELFGNHDLFRDPAFRSPITRTRDGTAERFVLTLRIRQPEGEE